MLSGRCCPWSDSGGGEVTRRRSLQDTRKKKKNIYICVCVYKSLVLRQRLRGAGALWSGGERRAASGVNPNLIRALQERVNFRDARGGFKHVPERRWKEGV